MAEERRLVTVLFADVVGSTELAESMDPEDLRALLAQFYAIAKDVVGSHGGTLEKFIGDAIMAVFGLPAAHGDDAERAVSAALEIRDRVRSEPSLGDRLAVRLGANTGEVVATRDRSAGDFLVTGDPVNVAARLQQAAEPWQVMCGERTVKAAAHAFTFGPLGGVRAKGKPSAVSAAPVLGRARADRARTPLFGRDADLAQLELLARRAFSERRPQLVSIVAAAGTGKTRLLEEFIDRLPAVAPSATVAIAQCLPYGERLTYWPLRGVLFRLAAIPEHAAPSEMRDRVRAWLQECGLEDAEHTTDLLAATIGAGEGEVTDRSELLAAWRSALEHAARREPLVIVFEDLHWSSDSLLDLVEFVMQPRGDLPVLMAALARPELLDRRPSWGGGRRNYVALALDPLADDAVARMVSHVLKTDAPQIVARVVARAEGNPFFAGELVRVVLDRVASFQDEPAIDRALAALPDTVQATILARLDLLSAEERRIMQLGSVLGRTFRTAGIAALDASLGDVASVVDRLVNKDLVQPAGTDAYVFRHILIHDVAYGTLPRSERARLHVGAGQWLEEYARGREDLFAELIAYHYREAASLARTMERDADIVSIRRKATTWLVRAYEVAVAGAADLEATRHVRAAIELAEPQELPDLYEKLGDAYTGDGSVDAYLMALRVFREQGQSDPDRELRLLSGALYTQMRWGGVTNPPTDEEMARLRREARELSELATDERAIWRFLTAESFYPFWQTGREAITLELVEEAQAAGRRALEIAERLGDARMQSAALDGIASVPLIRGDPRASRETARRRLLLGDRLSLRELVDAYASIAWTSVLMGELDEAVSVSRDGLARVQPGQVPRGAVHLVGWQTLALFIRGRWDEATACAEQLLHLWSEIGRTSVGASLRGFEAGRAVARARGDKPREEKLRDAMVEIVARHRQPGPARGIRIALATGEPPTAETLRFAARPEQADVVLDRLLAVLSDRATPPATSLLAELEAIDAPSGVILKKAQLARARGLAERDIGALTRALTMFEGIGAVPYAARARCERAHLAGDVADYATGTRQLEILGDVEQLERYEVRHRVSAHG